MFLPPDPNLYKDLPLALSNHKVLPLTTEERRNLIAKQAQRREELFYCRMLCRFGLILVNWGTYLTERYGRRLEQSAVPKAQV